MRGTLFLCGIVAGASMPALGPMARARWSALLADAPLQLHTAFSVESIADELCFVMWFASQRATQPKINTPFAERIMASPDAPAPAVLAAETARRPLLAAPGLLVLLPVYLFLGAMPDRAAAAASRAGAARPRAGGVAGHHIAMFAVPAVPTAGTANISIQSPNSLAYSFASVRTSSTYQVAWL